MTRPLITTDPTHEGAEQPMSDDLERTAAISDAFHEGFGTGIGHVEDELAARVAAAEARGYDRAIAKLRDRELYDRMLPSVAPMAPWAVHLNTAGYLVAVKETTDV
jgi:hypothetical protein